MMHGKVVGVVFLGLVCLASVEGSRVRRSSARAHSTSSSSGYGYSDVDAIIAHAFSSVIAKGNGRGTASSVARSAAKEIGFLYARAVAKTSGHVEVEGNGKADVKASASAHATASLYAEAIAEGFAAAIRKAGGRPSDFDAGRKSTVREILVDAYASANLRLSTRGGSASGSVTSIGEAAASVLAKAFSGAFAYVAQRHSGARVHNKTDIEVRDRTGAIVDSHAKTSGDSRAHADGDAHAEVDEIEIPRCRGSRLGCCYGYRVVGDKCAGRYRKRDYGSGEIWEYGNRKCRCF